jgi:hypothetical protein
MDMRTIVKTQIVQWKSNAEFVVENELKGKGWDDWDVRVSIINNGDYQNVKQFTCKNLDEANQLLNKGDEIVKYEFRLWDDNTDEHAYYINAKETIYKTFWINAVSEEEAREKVLNLNINAKIEIISITKNER